MKCLCAIYVSIGINKHFWSKWCHLSCSMTSSIIPYLSVINIWWCRGGQPWPCDLQMTAYKKGLLMHDVVQLTCLAANDILLMQKWNHAFFLLVIAHAWKWQIAFLPKEILIKKQTQWSNVSCRSVSRRSIIFVLPTETSGYFSITKFNNNC